MLLQVNHDHEFSIVIEGQKLEINCTAPQTVMTAIRSRKKYKKQGWSDKHIMIKQGVGMTESVIASHFPCTCLKDKVILTISKSTKAVEEERDDQPVLPKDSYSVFYIHKEGGKYTKKKKLFKNSDLKNSEFICVYGERESTVQEALERDSRFVELDDFELTDCDDPKTVIQYTDKVNNLNGRKFKIKLPKECNDKKKDDGVPKKITHKLRGQQSEGSGHSSGASGDTKQADDMRELKKLVESTGIRVIAKSDVNHEEIMKMLREQCKELKKQVEARYSEDYIQKTLKKVNFGKIEQFFHQVYTLRKLLEMAKSVCLVAVHGGLVGTGFVLFDNFIMTNAHLFVNCPQGDRLIDVNVCVVFNYETAVEKSSHCLANQAFICSDKELDYALLKVQPTDQFKMPPGLLEKLGEAPVCGGVCVIGHPKEDVKKIDLTYVIEPENRLQYLHQYSQNYPFVMCHISKAYGEDLKDILRCGSEAQERITYNTFMYKGSSGSPVFDAEGRVCGLHTKGLYYESDKVPNSVIEVAQSLETIVRDFVPKLQNAQQFMAELDKVADKNFCLKNIIESVRNIKTEYPDSDEEMQH
ncbi:serine protease FAM111A-like [Xyrichtys novacula]|uniref:Serine protease FAM111A-like n=1 Tax=Xyrichtys novacula TaxID=13765 RepID=A0AAV1F2I6_XYRNO|nr:serine protease FAM111A-like [Xyrichtys novacula]